MDKFPQQPRDKEGPIFKELWEAQAFGLIIDLHEQGLFDWDEWAQLLSEEISAAQAGGDPDLGDTYYSYWLGALEKMTALKGMSDQLELQQRIEQWRRAYLNTPHEKPIELVAGEQK